MLSIFPTLFDYSAIAISALRVIIALVFLFEGYRALVHKEITTTWRARMLPLIMFLGGLFLLAALFTQLDAFILSLVSLRSIYLEYKNKDSKGVLLHIVLFATTLSFLFLGPGLWGIDYPL